MSQILNIETPDGAGLTAEAPTPNGKRIYIETYGCQMNVSDTELMEGVLRRDGYVRALEPETADVILLNTCAIRDHAEARVLGRLSQLSYYKTKRPDMLLGVTGCMAKHLSEKLLDKLPYVDMVLGPDSYRRMGDIIREAADEPALDVRLDRDEDYLGMDPLRTEGTNAWITIMRGCDKFCTFCIVPYVRGRERSVGAEEIVRQAEQAAEEGFRQVTLLGQTVNSYRDGDTDFSDLLMALARVEGVRRIRFTSPHPSDFDQKFIDTMAAEPKICKYLHLPVQSGSDRVLAEMKRNYTVSDYLSLVERVRLAMPSIRLSTDVIVGFPGESADDFDETMKLVERVGFDFAFLFKYSEREGTAAHRQLADTVTEEEKAERLQAVIALQNRVSEAVNQEQIGKIEQVLVQGDARKGDGMAVGKTDGFKTVVFPRGNAVTNQFTDVRITGATMRTLSGEVVAVEQA